jgi:hypothetical protein
MSAERDLWDHAWLYERLRRGFDGPDCSALITGTETDPN